MEQSNPFVQLVSGVVWLLRNGTVYINQSLTAECDKTQETGTEAVSHVTEQLGTSLTLFLRPRKDFSALLWMWCRPGRRWATTLTAD